MDEDDGQISRMLVPVNEAFMKKDDDGEEQSLATLGLEQKGLCGLVLAQKAPDPFSHVIMMLNPGH